MPDTTGVCIVFRPWPDQPDQGIQETVIGAEDWIGVGVAAMYPAIIVVEHLRPARMFPKVRSWNVKLGIAIFIYMGMLNVAVVALLPLDWLAEHRLFDLARAGLLPSVVIGYLLTTLAMYAWHRAEHRFDLLWRGLHRYNYSDLPLCCPSST